MSMIQAQANVKGLEKFRDIIEMDVFPPLGVVRFVHGVKPLMLLFTELVCLAAE